MSSSNIEFKLRYNPQLHLFLPRVLSGDYNTVLYITNAKRKPVQVLVRDMFVRTDEYYMHFHISSHTVLEEQYSLRDLYCWRSIDGIRLVGGAATADNDKVVGEYVLEHRRGWLKRLLSRMRWWAL